MMRIGDKPPPPPSVESMSLEQLRLEHSQRSQRVTILTEIYRKHCDRARSGCEGNLKQVGIELLTARTNIDGINYLETRLADIERQIKKIEQSSDGSTQSSTSRETPQSSSTTAMLRENLARLKHDIEENVASSSNQHVSSTSNNQQEDSTTIEVNDHSEHKQRTAGRLSLHRKR